MCWRSSSPVVKKPLDTRPLHCGVAWGRRASARSKGRSPAGRYRCPRPCTLRVAVAVLVVVGPAHLPTGPLDMDETVLAHLLGLCSRLLWGPARPWRHLAVNVLFCFPGASHDPGSSSAAAMDAPRRGAVNVSDSPRAAERYLEAPSEYRTAGQVYCTVHTQMHKFESSIRRLVGGVAKRQTRRTAAKSPPPPPPRCHGPYPHAQTPLLWLDGPSQDIRDLCFWRPLMQSTSSSVQWQPWRIKAGTLQLSRGGEALAHAHAHELQRRFVQGP